MFQVSNDTPGQFFTSVAKDRLPVFRTDALKRIACGALDEARKSGKFLLFAYVIMPDHLHAITDSSLKPSETLRYINGIISRRILGYLKDKGHTSSLAKLRTEEKERKYKHSLWDHHSNTVLLTTEGSFMGRVNYLHQNPVRANLVEHAKDYRWSSFRIWNSTPLSDEPLAVDKDAIGWKRYP